MPSEKTNKSPPFKVLHVIESLEAGGAQRIIFQLCTLGDQRKIKGSVCGIHEGGPYEALFCDADIEMHVLQFPRRSILQLPLFFLDVIKILYRLPWILKNQGIDLIHAHLPDSSMLSIVTGYLCRIPVVITIHNNRTLPERQAPYRDRIRTAIEKLLFRRASALIAVGNDVKETQQAVLGSDVPIVAVFNGVDVDRFTRTVNIEGVRAQLGFLPSSTLLLTVGRLEAQKGHTVLLKAAAELSRRSIPVELLWVGTGSLQNSLEIEAASLGVSENVHFLGHRDDVEKILAASDIFVLPSLYEGIPVALLEAMAAGKPIVATDIKGNRELVKNGVDGFLVPEQNHLDLAEAIATLIADPERGYIMGQAAREKSNLFSLSQMIEKTEEVYLDVLGVHR
jgi:glycosyltransferase involved in cell wall biosynthesis